VQHYFNAPIKDSVTNYSLQGSSAESLRQLSSLTGAEWFRSAENSVLERRCRLTGCGKTELQRVFLSVSHGC
jgi:hypothetical protein